MNELAGHDAGYLHTLWSIASVIGVCVLVGAALLYRRARKAAETEEIERIIEEHDAGNPRRHHVSSRHAGPG